MQSSYYIPIARSYNNRARYACVAWYRSAERRSKIPPPGALAIGIPPNDSQVVRWSVACGYNVASRWTLDSSRTCISYRRGHRSKRWARLYDQPNSLEGFLFFPWKQKLPGNLEVTGIFVRKKLEAGPSPQRVSRVVYTKVRTMLAPKVSASRRIRSFVDNILGMPRRQPVPAKTGDHSKLNLPRVGLWERE